MKTDIIYNEDCLPGMSKLPNESIDLVATDPPYGIKFMSKSWDQALPSVNIWKEILRVLKPGAFAFVMCIPRQDCLARMIVSLEDAGFNVSFSSIYWTYASGFPKASNISKIIDRKLGAKRKDGKLRKGAVNPQGYKPGSGGPFKREFIDHLVPVTPAAQALDGSYGGFQPKPAIEVVIVAMKSLSEKTYVDQALANRHGISWLDEGRIPISIGDRHKYGVNGDEPSKTGQTGIYGDYNRVAYAQDNKGRFPANLLVSDDVLNDGKYQKTGIASMKKGGKIYGRNSLLDSTTRDVGGKRGAIGELGGSFSRYFSLDAWFDKKLSELPEGVRRTFPFLICAKASKAEKNRGCEGLPVGNPPGSKRSKPAPGRKSPLGEKRANHHPTVKPLKLFSYLITLGSRPGDLILDPFLGSGTTAISAKMLDRQYIGYEINKEYFEIAKARLKAVTTQLSLFKRG